MTITLDPELARRLEETARARNTTPEQIVHESLTRTLAPTPEEHAEWSRRLRSLARDCGVSLSDEATRRENMYD